MASPARAPIVHLTEAELDPANRAGLLIALVLGELEDIAYKRRKGATAEEIRGWASSLRHSLAILEGKL